jgi:hypothetical protein
LSETIFAQLKAPQNENLKNIIEIGKLTAETTKKISQDPTEENKVMKQTEIKRVADLKKLEADLKQIKSENLNLVEKTSNLSKLQESFNAKSNEVQQLYKKISANAAAKEDSKVSTRLRSYRQICRHWHKSKIT